jgi:hypothetical protein
MLASGSPRAAGKVGEPLLPEGCPPHARLVRNRFPFSPIDYLLRFRSEWGRDRDDTMATTVWQPSD